MKIILKYLLISIGFFNINIIKAQEFKDIPAINQLFKNEGVEGTFVFHCPNQNIRYGNNQPRANTQFIPASTFKIVNTLIGMELDNIREDEIFPYHGEPMDFPAWQKDMTIKEALSVSNVPIYQTIARRNGLEKMDAFIKKSLYGNKTIGNKVDIFWLEGPLKISAIEQTQFLN